MHQYCRSGYRILSFNNRRVPCVNLFRNLTSLWFSLGFIACLAITTPVLANDDVLIYSGYTNVVYGTMNYNNGWQDWGWVPHYVTNNPSFNGTNSIVFAANGGYQALHLERDPIDTTLYTNLTLWLDGGSVGGQTVGVQAEAGSTWGTRIYVEAPTNVWQQFTFSLASLGVANIANLNGIEIWNSGTLQSNFYIGDITLIAATPPATVHVSVNATNPVRTVDARLFGINTAAWDGDLDTPSTISVLTNMDNQALRWPGGSWGDGYFTGPTKRGARRHQRSKLGFLYHQFHPRGHQYARPGLSSSSTTAAARPQEAAYGVRMCNVTNHCNLQILGGRQRNRRQLGRRTTTPTRPGSRMIRGPTPCASRIITAR